MRCKLCKDKFTPKIFLQKHCFEKGECIKAERELKAKKQWKEKKAVIKESLLTISDYEKMARQVFQKWIRKRDENLPCISCENTSNRYDAGHYFDAGVYSGFIFNEDNVHKQCSYNCNKMQHGNKMNYRIGLVKKIGEEKVKWLEENKDRLKNYKYSKNELTEIKNKYLKLLKDGI